MEPDFTEEDLRAKPVSTSETAKVPSSSTPAEIKNLEQLLKANDCTPRWWKESLLFRTSWKKGCA